MTRTSSGQRAHFGLFRVGWRLQRGLLTATAPISVSADPLLPTRARGLAGLGLLVDEPDDFGEQTAAYAAALRRTRRRMMRWDEARGLRPPVSLPPLKRRKLAAGHWPLPTRTTRPT